MNQSNVCQFKLVPQILLFDNVKHSHLLRVETHDAFSKNSLCARAAQHSARITRYSRSFITKYGHALGAAAQHAFKPARVDNNSAGGRCDRT